MPIKIVRNSYSPRNGMAFSQKHFFGWNPKIKRKIIPHWWGWLATITEALGLVGPPLEPLGVLGGGRPPMGNGLFFIFGFPRKRIKKKKFFGVFIFRARVF